MNVCVRADCISMCEHSVTLSLRLLFLRQQATLSSILHSDFFHRIPNLRKDSKEIIKSEFVILLLNLMGKVDDKVHTCIFTNLHTHTDTYIHTYIHSCRISFSRLKYSTNWTESAMVRTYLLLRMCIYMHVRLSVCVQHPCIRKGENSKRGLRSQSTVLQ